MALRWDLLKNIGNNIQEGASNLANKILHANAPQIQPLQVAENGGLDAQRTLELALAQPKNFRERLGGRTVSIDTESVNPETNEVEVNRISKYQPGLLDDIRAGAKENFATGFATPNWEQTKTPDGRNKGFGYRFGEGVGSLAKFAETPLGRGLIMAGIVGAAGGSGLEALGYGTGAGLLNQQNRMKDKLYRDNLIRQRQDALKADKNFQLLDAEEQQAMLDAIAKEINSIRGYLGDTPYKNMVNAQIAQDNADYKRLYLDTQKKNQEVAEQMAQQKFDYQQKKDAQDLALANRKLAIEEAQANKPKPLSDSQVKDLKGTTDYLTALENIETIYNNPKHDSMFGIKGDIRRNNPLSRYDAEASLFNQDVGILRQRYAKLLEGGRLSDSDRAFYQKALFNPNVSRADFLEAVRRLKQTLQQDYNNALSMYAKQGKDIAGFELTPTKQTQATTNEGWAF